MKVNRIRRPVDFTYDLIEWILYYGIYVGRIIIIMRIYYIVLVILWQDNSLSKCNAQHYTLSTDTNFPTQQV